MIDLKHNISKPMDLVKIDGHLDGKLTHVMDSNDHEEKPLHKLLRKILKKDVSIQTKEILEILTTEFHIIPGSSLKSDIYLSVLKKFMKSWPQWPYFQSVMNSKKKNTLDFEIMLQYQYKSFKEYLSAILNACEPIAEEAAQQARTLTRDIASGKVKDINIVLEISSSRDQLNRLFFRKPHPDFNNSIFNFNPSVSSKMCGTLSLKTILNWWHVSVHVDLECFKYRREMIHELKHVLINEKLGHAPKSCLLKRNLQVKKDTEPVTSVMKTSLVKLIDSINDISRRQSSKQRHNIQTIFSVIQEDIRVLADVVDIPSSFRYFMNERPYVRYLYEDVDTSRSVSDKYDLKLEEELSPRLAFHLTTVLVDSKPNIRGNKWLRMACVLCGIVFTGFKGIDMLKQHFNEVHVHEPDFSCRTCKQTFSVTVLASSRWHHRCI